MDFVKIIKRTNSGQIIWQMNILHKQRIIHEWLLDIIYISSLKSCPINKNELNILLNKLQDKWNQIATTIFYFINGIKGPPQTYSISYISIFISQKLYIK